MIRWFKKKEIQVGQSLTVDLHSHLLATLDDGVKSHDEAIEIIRYFASLGYRKIVTTPHVMSDAYRNTPGIIRSKCKELRALLQERQIPVQLDCAAEYYLDEELLKNIREGKELLTLGEKYLLFETNFLSEPLFLKEFIFQATSKGYKLILAHPERYLYLQQDLGKAEDLLNRGVLFQINISSLSGFYSKPAQVTADKLIEKGWVHWLGSDCHQLQQVKMIEQAQNLKSFRKALSLPLLNNSL